MQTKVSPLLRVLVIGVISSLLMLLPTTQLSAQSAAEVRINKAAEKLRNKGTEILFRINEEGLHISGKLLMDGENFVYDTEEMKIWYDGTTQWTLQMGRGYNELYINNPTIGEQQAINPYLLLNNYKESFNVIDGGETNRNGRLTHKVVLESRDEEEAYSFNVYVSDDNSLSALEIIAPDGQSSIKIEVRSMRYGLTFPKETFTYQQKDYPADEIIDMR